ncbi:MAG: three-Cys-motif partner protein TcmP [Nocardioidaceae bacterium]|nr:three-Cys-motif partner protein TcmP [Nocardioidaceae bacterium]
MTPRRGDNLDTVWDRPAHTKAKHDILVKYLQAWFAIMGGSSWVSKAGVLDGFAGPGVYSEGEPGSPVLVLNALLDHAHFGRWDGTEFIFLFNEQDPERYASLDAVIADLANDPSRPLPKNIKIHPANRNFSELGEELLNGVTNGLIPLFAFVDPFGYKDCSMDLIRRLLQYDKGELFIYFDFNSVNRFATAGNVDDRFEELFGCDDFKNAPASGEERRIFLHDLYESQLRKVCSFAHVRSFAMVNEKGRIGNYLFFCTRDLQAFDRMKAAMWSLDRSGEYRFEDRLADQEVLFDPELDTRPLQDELALHFAGRTVSIDEVVNYVIADTPYYSGQVRRSTLKPMQADGRISSPNQVRRGTYPAGTLITFP